jgi:hypothetical protein
MDTRYAEQLGMASDHGTSTTEKAHENTALEEVREVACRHVTNAHGALEQLDVLLHRLFGPDHNAEPAGTGPAEVPSGLVAEIGDAQGALSNVLAKISRRVNLLSEKL